VPSALVTGGAGFIGSHLVRALLREGTSVRVLDDLSSGSEANLEGVEVDFVRGDVCDRRRVAAAVEGVNRVFHTAAFISVPESFTDPRRCYEVNVLGTLTVLDEARRAGVGKVILSSSCAVYGEHDLRVAEGAELRGGSPYAESKIAMERVGALFGVPTLALRYFNVYGPHQSPTGAYAAVIPAWGNALLHGTSPTIYGDGGQTRDFIFVEDAVHANLLASESSLGDGRAFNIGSGAPISILELAQKLQRLIPDALEFIHAPARPGDLRASQADIRAAEEQLGFHPQVGLTEGLAATVEWLRQRDATGTYRG
jgi:UDP-glucose 4-epimerase